MSKLVLVLGTDGAGKTSVLNGVKSARTVNVGTELYTYYSKKFGVSARDRIRVAQLAAYGEALKIRNVILRKIAKMNGTIAIDTHAFVKAVDGYMPGLSLKDLAVLKGKIGAIIYIDADSKQIIKRRQSDKTRNREVDSEEELNRERSINLMFSTQYALYLEAPMYIVKNEDGKLAATQGRVNAIIRSIKW